MTRSGTEKSMPVNSTYLMEVTTLECSSQVVSIPYGMNMSGNTTHSGNPGSVDGENALT